jgi:hypothetical protein
MSDAQAASSIAAGSYAGGGMNEAAIAAAQKAAGAGDGGVVGGGGGRSGGSSTPMSQMDRLKASGTIGSLADSMRITDRKSQDYQRARDESAKGRYNTAAGMMQRADAREQRSIESARLKDTARQQGFDNFDQMFRKANESMPIMGKMTKEEYKKLLEGSSMSQDQKKAAQEDKKSGGGKAGQPSPDSLLNKVSEIYNWMTNNLPSNALSS